VVSLLARARTGAVEERALSRGGRPTSIAAGVSSSKNVENDFRYATRSSPSVAPSLLPQAGMAVPGIPRSITRRMSASVGRPPLAVVRI